MTLLASLLRPSNAVDPNEQWAKGEDGWEGNTPAGVKVTRETAIQLSAVWACVRLLSDTIATLPVGTFRRDGDLRIPTDRKRWVDEPNREQTRVEFVEQQVGSLLLDGNAFIETTRDRFGDVVEMYNVHPDYVTPKRVGGRIVYEVAGYDDPENVRTVPGLQMFHIPCFAWPGQLRGVSPIEHARRVIGLGLASQEYAERFYGQGMHSAGFIEAKEELTPEQGRELKKDFTRLNSGLKKSHLPAVLANGATWKPLSVTPEQGQFLESRKYSVSEISRWFRVPPHLISDVERTTSWGTGIEEQNIGFVTYGIRHWLERLEQSWTRHLLAFDPDEFVKFNVDGLLRGDQKSRYEAYGLGRHWGFLNADEIRAREDMPPLPGGAGQEYLKPTTHQGAAE